SGPIGRARRRNRARSPFAVAGTCRRARARRGQLAAQCVQDLAAGGSRDLRKEIERMAVRLTTPVTIVTGFLGSGKTTLINRILRETHGQRIAVIENEYGAIGVDAEFLVGSGAETVIQLANGCVCCTVRGDLARALQQLMMAGAKGGFEFDRVLIETTGLADPGPVIQTFLAETRLQEHFHLDGVVALVDAHHLHEHLTRVETRAEIVYADRLLLTKIDRCRAAQARDAETALASLNPRAPIVACNVHDEPIAGVLEHLFGARGYALDYVP